MLPKKDFTVIYLFIYIYIFFSGSPNNTLIMPLSKQGISWNQSQCLISGRIVEMFQVFLFNNLKVVLDAKKKVICLKEIIRQMAR